MKPQYLRVSHGFSKPPFSPATEEFELDPPYGLPIEGNLHNRLPEGADCCAKSTWGLMKT